MSLVYELMFHIQQRRPHHCLRNNFVQQIVIDIDVPRYIADFECLPTKRFTRISVHNKVNCYVFSLRAENHTNTKTQGFAKTEIGFKSLCCLDDTSYKRTDFGFKFPL
eukprot:9069038-Karenia_brevis.AAC.1